MELRSTFITCFFLILFLVHPCFSREGLERLQSEIYEIDYRGPHTHSWVPPPHHSHGKPHSNDKKNLDIAVGQIMGLKGSSTCTDKKLKGIHIHLHRKV
ncbi:hypothetical protein Lal_00038101 [Lupinus albus]|nr:hypothetical protein Lal_00038101 [Lupinus albus]